MRSLSWGCGIDESICLKNSSATCSVDLPFEAGSGGVEGPASDGDVWSAEPEAEPGSLGWGAGQVS
jgi:hypothetical protein